jgi:hypothetical protein
MPKKRPIIFNTEMVKAKFFLNGERNVEQLALLKAA